MVNVRSDPSRAPLAAHPPARCWPRTCVLRWGDVAGAAYCPPVAGLASGPVGHLLCWERHDRCGSWQAWVSWVQESGSRPVHKLVGVPAGSLTLAQMEGPDAYRQVPGGSWEMTPRSGPGSPAR
jgi:hypothetical protein